MNSWQIGEVRVTRIVELESAGGTRFILPDASPDAVKPISWLAPHFMTAEGKLIMSVHALVIEAGDRRILVDTCIGNDKQRKVPSWNNLQTGFLNDMKSAGFDPDSIDTVLCTHMHVDHVGWNTRLEDGKWVPTFPKARYLFAQTEWEHWQSESQDEYGAVIEDSVTPIVAAGLADFVLMDHRICEQVFLIPSPGHTPGHVSVGITSQGQEALITGDFMHHPCQMARTDWCSSADFDKQAAQAMREKMLRQLAGRDILVIGTHFATPTAGHVIDDGEGRYRLQVTDA